MDAYIDQMITKNIKPTEIMIQSKTQTGDRSIRSVGMVVEISGM